MAGPSKRKRSTLWVERRKTTVSMSLSWGGMESICVRGRSVRKERGGSRSTSKQDVRTLEVGEGQMTGALKRALPVKASRYRLLAMRLQTPAGHAARAEA